MNMGDATVADEMEAERMAALLESTGRFRILRRLETRSAYHVPDGTITKRGIYLDTETTGLDPTTDEIIELAMVPFDFSSDGRIFDVGEPFGRFRDPGRPIPPEVTALTGISDAMVAGHAIDSSEVEAFVGGAVLVVAHNAGFDRKFAERLCGGFAHVAWACSWQEIPWNAEGFEEGTKLANLLAACGLYHTGHRAVDDCRAGIELLSQTLPRGGRRALDALLRSARTPRWRVRAIGAPYELKDSLKRRGYRWDGGEMGRPKAWYIDVTDDALDVERDHLRGEIYRRQDVDIEAVRIDAFDRYSDRC